MSLIDQNGKLFGKINIIDFAVILFLISLLPMVYFGKKILARNLYQPQLDLIEEAQVLEPEREKVFITKEIDCTFIKLTPELAKLIAVGDQELDQDGEVIGEIIELGKIEPYQYRFNVSHKERMTSEDEILKQVQAKLKIKAVHNRGRDTLHYKDKQVLDFWPIVFKTDTYQVEASITFKDADKDKIDPDLNKMAALRPRAQYNICEFCGRKYKQSKAGSRKGKLGTFNEDLIQIGAEIDHLKLTVQGLKENDIGDLNSLTRKLFEDLDRILSSPKIRKLLK
ncbi:DUF4330 family protein [Candidatus Omnitrophota bacterium]